MPWRRSFVEGRDAFESGRFRREVVEEGVEMAIAVTPEQWRRFD